MIAENLQACRAQLPEGVKLVCVSKFHPAGDIREAYQAGERCFGESHVQEMVQKQAVLPQDIEWHFIGHLQTNKVKQIVPFVSLIHAVDSMKLLNEINSQAAKAGRHVHVLLEVKIARESTKYGFSEPELISLLSDGEWRNLPFVQICGLMGMATNTDDAAQVSAEFRHLRLLFDQVKTRFFAGLRSFDTLSMGMSGDYPLAVAEGSNLVRIGTAIFGERK